MNFSTLLKVNKAITVICTVSVIILVLLFSFGRKLLPKTWDERASVHASEIPSAIPEAETLFAETKPVMPETRSDESVMAVVHPVFPSKSYFMREDASLSELDSPDWEDQYFWGQKTVKRGQIRQIQFLIEKPFLSADAFGWDVSEKWDGTVMAYVDSNILYVVSQGRIAFPKNSSYLLAGFCDAEYITFENPVDTSEVVNMERLFSSNGLVQELDLSWFNTSKVTNMGHMFAGNKALTQLDLTSFDTSKVTDMDCMFYACNHLLELNISSFNTGNVTTMRKMFAYCERIPEIDVSSFDTSRVKYMSDMFRDCYALESMDLSTFRTPDLEDINTMFYACTSLKHVEMRNLDMSRVYCMVSTFQGCKSLKNVDAVNWNLKRTVRRDNFMDSDGMINNAPWRNYFNNL